MNFASKTCTTGTSTTSSNVLQLRDHHSFLTSKPQASVVAQRRACERQCPAATSCNCGISSVSSPTALEELAGPAQQRHGHLVNELQLVFRTVETMRIACVTTGMSTTLTTVNCAPGVAQERARQTVQEQHLNSLGGRVHSLHCGHSSLQA